MKFKKADFEYWTKVSDATGLVLNSWNDMEATFDSNIKRHKIIDIDIELAEVILSLVGKGGQLGEYDDD